MLWLLLTSSPRLSPSLAAALPCRDATSLAVASAHVASSAAVGEGLMTDGSKSWTNLKLKRIAAEGGAVCFREAHTSDAGIPSRNCLIRPCVTLCQRCAGNSSQSLWP